MKACKCQPPCVVCPDLRRVLPQSEHDLVNHTTMLSKIAPKIAHQDAHAVSSSGENYHNHIHGLEVLVRILWQAHPPTSPLIQGATKTGPCGPDMMDSADLPVFQALPSRCLQPSSLCHPAIYCTVRRSDDSVRSSSRQTKTFPFNEKPHTTRLRRARSLHNLEIRFAACAVARSLSCRGSRNFLQV